MSDFDDRVSRPKTHELEVVVAIARVGSLGGAAADLGCTQSSVSHALAEMESKLGFRIFERSRIGARPTEAGATVVARARDAIDAIDAMAHAREGAAYTGTVRIATYRSAGTHILAPIGDTVAKSHPGISLEIQDECLEHDDVEDMVRAGRSDLGVVELPVGEGLDFTSFVQDDIVVVVAARCQPRETPIWKELSSMPFFELRCLRTSAVVTECRRNGMTNRTIANYSAESTILAQVSARDGFTILPRLAAEPLHPGLVAIPLPTAAFRDLALIRRNDRQGPLVRFVIQTLLAEARRPSFAARKWLRMVIPPQGQRANHSR